MTSIKLVGTIGAYPSRITALAYSPRGDTIACGYQDGGVVSWNVPTGTIRATFAEPTMSYTDPILSVAFSPDGALLASTNLDYFPTHRERTVYVWRTSDNALAYKLGGFSYWIYAVAFSADGALLAVGGDDRWVKLYDAQSGEECGPILPQLPYSVSSLAFNPHGQLLVAGCDGCEIHLWNLAAEFKEYTMEGHVEWTWTLAFHPSGALVASGGEDGAIILWDMATAERICSLRRRKEIAIGEWWGNSVVSLTFNPQGTLLASASTEHNIELWDTSTLERILVVRHVGVSSVAFSPNGALLASGGNNGIKLWQISTD